MAGQSEDALSAANNMKKFFTYGVALLTGIFYSYIPILAAAAPADRGLSQAPGVDITIQSLFGILQGLACYATRVITIIMVIMIVWYGFQMMAAQGSDTKFTSAKKSLGYAIIGMIVVLGAYTIIATVGNTVESIGAQDLSNRSESFINYTPLGSCSM